VTANGNGNGHEPQGPPEIVPGPAPCFNFGACRRLSEVEHQGKSLCRPCAAKLPGAPYPLRGPSSRPLYDPGEEGTLARQLNAWWLKGPSVGFLTREPMIKPR
jgi:hypothetical protein